MKVTKQKEQEKKRKRKPNSLNPIYLGRYTLLHVHRERNAAPYSDVSLMMMMHRLATLCTAIAQISHILSVMMIDDQGRE